MLGTPAAAFAQTLNLYEAVGRSITNYPVMRQRQAEVAAGRAHLSTVNGNRFPALILQDQFDLGTDNSQQGAYFSLGMVPSTPGSYSTVHNNPNQGNTAISFLKWDFFTFGYYSAQTQEAKAQLSVNEANAGSTRYLLTENIVSLYLDWLKKYRLLRIQVANMQRAQVLMTAIRAAVLSGLKPGVDSSTAGAAYTDAYIGYLQALDNVNQVRINICAYTGLTGQDLVPDTNAVTPALLQSLIAIESNGLLPGHPILEVYEKQYELQQASNKTVSRKYLPKFGLDGAAWMRSSGISPSGVYPESLSEGMPYSRSNYLLGLTFSYNLFDLRRRHDEMTEGRYLMESKKQAIQTQQLSLNTMLQQATSTCAITLQKLNELPKEVAALKQAYDQQLALYKAGLNTLPELTNALYALSQAETNLVITQDNLLQLLYIKAGLAGQSDNYLQKFKQ
jgi:outer membrane protein TolC